MYLQDRSKNSLSSVSYSIDWQIICFGYLHELLKTVSGLQEKYVFQA